MWPADIVALLVVGLLWLGLFRWFHQAPTAYPESRRGLRSQARHMIAATLLLLACALLAGLRGGTVGVGPPGAQMERLLAPAFGQPAPGPGILVHAWILALAMLGFAAVTAFVARESHRRAQALR